MPRLLLLVAAVLSLGGILTHAATLLQPQDSVVIAGDSITEQKMYTVDMEDYFLMCQPVPLKRVSQLGWGGETASGFLNRLTTDLYPFQPTVVTTCYGMNDGGYSASTPDKLDTYRKNQVAIVEDLKKHGVRVIVVGSSKCVDTYWYDGGDLTKPAGDIYNKTLSDFNDIDRDVAQKEGVVYADVYGATMTAMQKSKAVYGQNYTFGGGGNGVHPGPNGQLVMAYAFLKALGCDGNIGTLSVNMGLQQATGSPGQKIVSFSDGTLEVQSSRYPFCFDGDPTKPEETTASIIRFVPFNEELNRYMLVVTGLTTPKAKITWGKTSKDYSADELKKGINLAAEFITNPFSDQFHKINDLVSKQQGIETPLVKEFLHGMSEFKNMAPDDGAELEKIGKDGVAHTGMLYQNAAAMVTPVDHKIVITPES